MKKTFSKIIALLLALAMLFLVGCSNNVPAISQDPKEQKKDTLINLDISSLGDASIEYADSNEEYCVVSYYNYIGEQAGEVEIDETELIYHLAVFDVKQNKLITSTEYENDGKYYKIVINDNGFELLDNDSENKLIFDYSLNQIGSDKYDFEENWKKGERIESISTDNFDCRDSYAITDDYSIYSALLFYDTPDEFKVVKSNASFDYRNAVGHKILINDISGNKNNDFTNVYSVLDFDTNEIVNTVRIKNDLDFNNVAVTSINEHCATVCNAYDNGKLKEIFVWNYNEDANSKPFDDGYCQTVKADDIDTALEEISAQIKQKYNIVMECKADKKFFYHDVENDAVPIVFYLKACDIQNDLGYLPLEFYNELLCNDLDNAESKFDRLHIYLVGSVVDDTSAFAGDECNDETNNESILYITFTCSFFSEQTFFHEMLHQMEYRIECYDKDIDKKWEALNPKGFEYDGSNEDVFFDNDEWQKYFVRSYGVTGILEDRADCFGTLCESAIDNDYWWNDRPELVEKMNLISDTVQASFPSLSKNAFWI